MPGLAWFYIYRIDKPLPWQQFNDNFDWCDLRRFVLYAFENKKAKKK